MLATSARRSWMARSRSPAISVRARSTSASPSALDLARTSAASAVASSWADERGRCRVPAFRASSRGLLDLRLHFGQALLGLLVVKAQAGLDLVLAFGGGRDDSRVDVFPEDEDHQDERDQLGEERPVGVEKPGRLGIAITVSRPLLFGDDVDEEESEREVDEVHPFDQPDDQEHGHLEPALGLGLTGGTGDGRVPATVTDGGADRAAAERRVRLRSAPPLLSAHGSCRLSPQVVACAAAPWCSSRPSRAMPK